MENIKDFEKQRLPETYEIEEYMPTIVEKLTQQYPKTMDKNMRYLVGGTLRNVLVMMDSFNFLDIDRDVDLIVPHYFIECYDPEKKFDNEWNAGAQIYSGSKYSGTNYFGGIVFHEHSKYLVDNKFCGEYNETKFDLFSFKDFGRHVGIVEPTIEDYVNNVSYNVEGLAWDLRYKKLIVSEKYSTKELIKQSNLGFSDMIRFRGRKYHQKYGLRPDESTFDFLYRQEDVGYLHVQKDGTLGLKNKRIKTSELENI